tara:strand:- start:353 stop:1192 length:840 start_codon:yes stop_codon:yes gene_type:complete
MKKINFTKMHGIGNDFVIIDNRPSSFVRDNALIKKICDRKSGIGCDQLILIEESKEKIADAKIVIFNNDGSEVETCGNASRCVGQIIFDQQKTDNILIETAGGLLDVVKLKNNLISVDMGIAKFDWRDIPLSEARTNNNVGIDLQILRGGFAVNVGNPHIVFFVDNIEMNLEKISKECLGVSKMSLFPKGININIAEVLNKKSIKLIIYERGVGFTDACGSGACATLTASYKLGYTENDVKVQMRGGELEIEYMADNHILMTGPVSKSFDGNFDINHYK